jgi:hypothetical protein
MLEMRPGCERCDKDLPPDADDAIICSFECTFCTHCANTIMDSVCPNCGGDFSPRPTRKGVILARFPASTERIYNSKLRYKHGS